LPRIIALPVEVLSLPTAVALDLGHEHTGGGQQVGQVDAVPEVEGGDVRLDVARALARGVGDLVLPDPPVDAGDVAVDHLARLPTRSARPVLQQALDDPAVVEVGDDGVDLQVGRAQCHLVVVDLVRPEPPRPLTAPGHQGVEQRAQAHLGSGVPAAVAQADEVLGLDVRDAVLGPGDVGAVAVGLPGCLAGCWSVGRGYVGRRGGRSAGRRRGADGRGGGTGGHRHQQSAEAGRDGSSEGRGESHGGPNGRL
jgi:hypothetical protein